MITEDRETAERRVARALYEAMSRCGFTFRDPVDPTLLYCARAAMDAARPHPGWGDMVMIEARE